VFRGCVRECRAAGNCTWADLETGSVVLGILGNLASELHRIDRIMRLWVYPFMYQFRCIGSCIAFANAFDEALEVIGPRWITLDHAGSRWTTLDHAGPRWTTLDHAGRCWESLRVARESLGVAQNVTRASSWAAEGGTGRRPQPTGCRPAAGDAGGFNAVQKLLTNRVSRQ